MPSASACFQSASVAMWKIRTPASCRTHWHSGAMSDLHCPARIIVARHGEAEYESDAMTAAGGSLTALGRDQARALGERLSGERVAGIVTSDLARAVQTAELVARVLDLPVRVREGLQEFPPGDFWGRPYDHAFFGDRWRRRGWPATWPSAYRAARPGEQTADRGAGRARRASPTSSAERPCSWSATGA